jgi:lysophospholipase L1-like esterase
MVSSPASTHTKTSTLTWKKRIAYAGVIYLAFILVLPAIEVVTRLTLPHLSSLDLFVNTPQQKAQVADPKQSGIFEGDPLLLWRLKPNLDRVVWDFTVVSTNSEHFRANYPLKAKAPGAIRIICLGDSVTFGYRVPTVWPERPTDYDPSWLPYPMLLEKHLREANPGREVEVIAMAVPGYTSHQGLAWLKRDIDWLVPDLVTVSFGWNDASLSDVPDRQAVRVNWSAVLTRWMVDHSQAFAHATKWLRSKNGQAPARRKPVPRVSEGEFLNNMLEIVKLARERKAGVIVIGAPYRDPVTNPPEAQLMTRYRSALRQTMQRMNIHFLEIRELTESAHPANEGWFGELIHPNHMGHRLITAELCKLLQSNSLPTGVKVPQFIP